MLASYLSKKCFSALRCTGLWKKKKRSPCHEELLQALGSTSAGTSAARVGQMQAVQIQAVADHREFPAQEGCK